ncbi:Sec-independent protein translocase protein TatB [Hyphomonas sp.]|uniref:Sec-independent protein translocase protein TatB n=1 Tax=Hyphomonas sp. TaxID=87 RepID=UPI0025C73DDC|nr:Sec-independent protein translocase protein TatB [Hyphomonas sp.]MBI1401086.1 twin-arginine translocase subunit TatB [Hyphomonas sp.]
MLPGIGFSEILVLGLAALIFIGPKDLPLLMRKLGQIIGKGRRMASEFQAAFDDIARQSELDELKKEIEALKRSNAMTQAAEDLAAVEADINSAVMRSTPDAAPEPEPEPDAQTPPPAPEDKAP